ncbi:putative ABC transporter ATP-binding protein YbhF [bacterium BMS3Bbin11]|nr:putative ABC transporter ATP-binding protein YbhF [bacterium BMS3Abin11]GBE45943.1 putative ABC transporter ATP-binding protein YbhF [bacterium BMS3Bbin11]GMT40678.1 MAG: ABC transporter ATP-binding protein [bacterium]HDH08195.1 ABC transporter ATP-binding protein [Gammaproteobacteria bacterium]HDH16314.1 ABC transporter ATP-binding protein [Gammaproteobacteria bacterium]
MKALVTAKGLTKNYGRFRAVDNVDFEIKPGRIVGLVGPNGAGKSTTLKAILGLINYRGELEVFGRNPRNERAQLMHDISYISDVASLPEWIRVDQLLDLMESTHPSYDLRKSLNFLARTDISKSQRVKHLSKGMKTQLHLAIVMGINARMLVLDEPTMGLDIIYRTEFYDQLMNEYFDQQRTILITTHQIEEIEHILTDIIIINKGKIVINMPVEEIGNYYVQLKTAKETADQARKLNPVYERDLLDEALMIFENIGRDRLLEFGEVSTPHLADLFVAAVKGRHHA